MHVPALRTVTSHGFVAAIVHTCGVAVASVTGSPELAVAVVSSRTKGCTPRVRPGSIGTIVMVCGVTVLISLLEKTNGLDLFTDLLARIATPATVVPLLAA